MVMELGEYLAPVSALTYVISNLGLSSLSVKMKRADKMNCAAVVTGLD